MELKDTVGLMISSDWRDRFKAEYLLTKIRYEKLYMLIILREIGQLDFVTPIPIESWKDQEKCMRLYLCELAKQAAIHGIELPKISVTKNERVKTEMEKRELLIAFTDEEFEEILAFQKQEGQETVQEAIMDAVRACLKD